MTVAVGARIITAKAACAVYKVPLDAELEKLLEFSMFERAMLQRLAPQAEEVLLPGGKLSPQLAAMGFAALYVVSSVQLGAAIRARAPKKAPKKKAGSRVNGVDPAEVPGSWEWSEKVRDAGLDHGGPKRGEVPIDGGPI